MSENDKKKVLTVLGWIDPEEVGTTLAHEHLCCSAEAFMVQGPAKEFPELGTEPLSLKLNWWVTHNPYSSFDNVKLYEESEAVIDELKFFKSNGGSTVVENSSIGFRPNPEKLYEYSSKSGVNIVAGSAFYVRSARPDTVHYSQEMFGEAILKDITEGFGTTNIRAGVIGEIGCSWPLEETEKSVLRAAAQIESDIGCPVLIHPGRHHESPFEIIRTFTEAGGHVDRVVMSHLDRTIYEDDKLLEFAEMGCYVEFDQFGLETSYYQLCEEIDMPNDAHRIQKIKALIEGGFEDRLTIGHDIHTKHRLMKYGGSGYSHILLHVVPKMLQRGITQNQVDKILKDNPKRWLTFTK